MNPFVSNGNKLRWKFENVKDLGENERYSEEFMIGPTKWKIDICKAEFSTGNLRVCLCYTGDNVNESNWICQTEETITLINQNENGKNKSNKCIGFHSYYLGWCDSYGWDDLMKYGYIKNDSIIIEVDLNFKYYDFSKYIPTLTDITFKVEDTEFHTNKGVLCTQSEYFYDLFINKNHEENMIEIKDIEEDDFIFFLGSFYPFFEGVDEENCEKLIELAEKYKVPTLHKKCENYLIKDTEISVKKKFEYAEKYDYYDLMKECVQSLDNARKIKNIQNTEEFYNFKESTKLMIMKKILDFC